MAKKTYIPALYFLLYKFVQYCHRYEKQIKAHLTSGQVSQFTTLLAAADTLLIAIAVVHGE